MLQREGGVFKVPTAAASARARTEAYRRVVVHDLLASSLHRGSRGIVTNTTIARLIHVLLTGDQGFYTNTTRVLFKILYELFVMHLVMKLSMITFIFKMTFWLTNSRSHL